MQLFPTRETFGLALTGAGILVLGVALGAAFWILALNSWMQTPQGHEVIDGVYHVRSWAEVIFNLGADEVEITEILVKVGDKVEAEQSLITVEGDKASMEVPSPQAGIVKEIKVSVGDKTETGKLIMIFDSADGAAAAAPAAPASSC